MAFFGLTQVGPQSQFHAVLLDAMDLTLFTDDEFARAFAKLDKDKSGFLDISEVKIGLCVGGAGAALAALGGPHTNPVESS